MPRLIDGDRLIDWLEIVPLENGMIYPDTVVEYIREMSTVATDINVPGGWTSVKDRLPEIGKVVLAFGTRSATTGMFQGVSKRNDLWWWKGHTIKHVSHWMPLPESPKEEE